MALRLSANLPMLQRQVSHIPYPQRQLVISAISFYVLGDNLFHVRAEKPFRTLLVRSHNLLVKRRFGELIAAALLCTKRGTLQFRHIRTRNQQTVVDVDQQWSVGGGR